MFENSSVSPEHHESYGLAQFSRIGGKSGKLFGSSIEHQHFIELTISRASRSRQFQHDHYMPDQELISVFMSPTQFAELLTSLNVGTGVPVTIKHIAALTGGEAVPSNGVVGTPNQKGGE